MSLLTKYRPTNWDEVVGQGVTTTILRRQIASGGVKQAYLFVGSAGTGKTTCARLLAKSINGDNGIIIEMDSASHNGVDDVRQIAEDARTQSILSPHKVFILDECHAFSNSAWQAWLKLLEEPPAGTVFIFCTTEDRKIPSTVISRVQSFYFHPVPENDICDVLMMVAKAEGIKLSTHGAVMIAKLSDGGVRTALSILEKCSDYTDREIDSEVVNQVMLGYPHASELACNYINALASGDVGELEKTLDIIENVELTGFIERALLISHTRYWEIDIVEFLANLLTEVKQAHRPRLIFRARSCIFMEKRYYANRTGSRT